ncbi:MAG: transglycosylase domain-containing protein [Spirochaetes bacterium]|nr:transglycosylase domain-containing protein [Spirochaetota bacterium]
MQLCSLFSNYRPYRIIKALAVLFCMAIVTYIAIPYKQNYLATHNRLPITIYDRYGTVLMEIARDKSGLAQYIDFEKVPEEFIALLLFSEDRKFYLHHGVSPSAIARAIYQNIKAMRVVSGGSTITQQLVKSKKEILRNTIWTKVLEIIEAIRLEMHFTKREILAAYINEVYLGNNIYGFEKASQCYFGKSFTDCNLLEAAFLISIVKSPGRYNPYKNPEIIVQNAKRLLQKANESGFLHISPSELSTYMQKKISLQYTDKNITAPLFCLYVLSQAKKLFPDKDIVHIYTTLDVHLYKNILSVMQNSLDIIKDCNALHAAMVMIDNTTMEILVMIGSVDFFDYDKGQVDATLIRRQAASTMKPFAYALALDKGIFHTSSILPDVYTQFYSRVGTYIPKNFSQSYHGPVRLAKALGCSYNIPAVYVVNAIGLVPYYNFLKQIGFFSITRSPTHYGLGIVLGNADVTLIELANAYTIFPRNGIFSKAVAITKIKDAQGNVHYVQKTTPQRFLKPSTCYLISHILSNYSYKVDAFGAQSAINLPFPFAVKTGTSKDFRDNFIAGYNTRFTIGVWVGNLYNKPMFHLPAVSGAGIVLKDVLLYLWNAGYEFPSFKPVSKIKAVMVCKLSGMVADKYCHDTYTEYYDEDNTPTMKCTWHLDNKTVVPVEYREWAKEKKILYAQSKELKIIFPHNGSVFKIEKVVRKNIQAIPLKAQAPGKNVKWYVNGYPVGTGNEVVWRLIHGEHTITVKDNEQMDSVRIIVLD